MAEDVVDRTRWASRAGLGALTVCLYVEHAWADYEAPNIAYAAPTSYYASATGSGTTLKSQLYSIISTGARTLTYGDARFWAAVTDVDPANPNNILLAYNRASVDGTWDSGVTWNREHVIPQSRLNVSNISNTYKGPASDCFELRPANPTINSTRSNNVYGHTGIASPHIYGNNTVSGVTYWYAGDSDRGDVARSCFYMATRYGQNQANNISLVNGDPSTLYKMGDLASLLKWNYEDGVDNWERRRNQAIYSSAMNPTYYQGNRNPFIDHPEYVWSIFGASANDSKLYVGTSASSNGATNATVNLGQVIVGGTLSSSTITLNKSGATPTTYDLTTSGEATSTSAGAGQPFAYNAQSRAVTVALSSSTGTAGAKSGTITINNTDLTSLGTGQGSADGNDTITVTASVLAHSSASFNPSTVSRALTLDFGTVAQNSTPSAINFGIANLATVANYTAGLDLDAIAPAGSSSILTTSLTTFSNLGAGTTQSFAANIGTGSTGTFTSSYVLATSDQNLSGATAGSPMTLTLTGRVLVRQWYTDTSAQWASTTSWLGSVPTTTADSANFLGTITSPRTVTVASNQTVGTMTFDNANQYTLSGSGTITFGNSSATSTLTVTSGTHAIAAPVAVNKDLNIQVTRAADTLTISQLQPTVRSITKTGAGQLMVNVVRAAGLSVSQGAVKMSPNGTSAGVSQITNLVIAPTAQFDLADNALIIPGGGTLNGSAITRESLHQLLATGRGLDGTWNHAGGIMSSSFDDPAGSVLGYVFNSDVDKLVQAIESINGVPVGPNDAVVAYTYAGDVTLDHKVDDNDVAVIGLEYGIAESGLNWYDGDLTYDGKVNDDDVAIIGLTYGVGVPLAPSAEMYSAPLAVESFSSGVAIVPEPASLGLLALGSVACLRRRRRVLSH